MITTITRIFLICFLLLPSLVSSQEYWGEGFRSVEILKLNSDSTFSYEERGGDLWLSPLKGKYKLVKDTLILNTFEIPNDSFIEVLSFKNDSLKLSFKFRDKAGRQLFVNHIALWKNGIKNDICNKQILDNVGWRFLSEIESTFENFDSLEIITFFTGKQIVIKSVSGNNDYTVVVDRTYDFCLDIYNKKYLWRRNKLVGIEDKWYSKVVLRRRGALVWW